MLQLLFSQFRVSQAGLEGLVVGLKLEGGREGGREGGEGGEGGREGREGGRGGGRLVLTTHHALL